MVIGRLKTLTLLILVRQAVNPILILGTMILMCLISNANTSPIPSLILTAIPIVISKKDVDVPDIHPDTTNEQESDGSGLILEKKFGNNLLDLLPVEILEKVFLEAMKLSYFSFSVHICWKFNHAIAAISQLEKLKQSQKIFP